MQDGPLGSLQVFSGPLAALLALMASMTMPELWLSGPGVAPLVLRGVVVAARRHGSDGERRDGLPGRSSGRSPLIFVPMLSSNVESRAALFIAVRGGADI